MSYEVKPKHVCQLNLKNPFHEPNRLSWDFIRKITTISEHHPLTKFYFRSIFLLEKEKRRHTCSKNWFTIHPFSSFSYIWAIIMMFIYGIVIIDICYFTTHEAWLERQDFAFENRRVKFGIFINFIYFIDIVLHFFTGYMVRMKKTMNYHEAVSEIELDKKQIAKHYFKTFFFIDLITVHVLRYYFVYEFIYRGKLETYDLHILIGALRVVRLLTIRKTIRMLTHSWKNHQYCLDMLSWNIVVPFVIYIIACVFIVVPVITSHVEGKKVDNFVQEILELHKYASVHLTPRRLIAVTSKEVYEVFLGGFGYSYFNLNLEDVVIYMMTLILGYIFRVWFLAMLIMIFNIKYTAAYTFDRFVSYLGPYMSYKHLNLRPQQYVMRNIKKHYKLELFTEKYLLLTSEKRVIFEIFTLLSVDLIRTCHIFRKEPIDSLMALASKLRRVTYVPGQLVMKEGEEANCMYFIGFGTVAVYSREVEMCHYSDGDYFGEIGLLYNNTSGQAVNILTIEFSVLYRLDVKDFNAIMKPETTMYNRIQSVSRRRTTMMTKKIYA